MIEDTYNDEREQEEYETLKDEINYITDSMNNVNGEAAHLRDTFLTAEREYTQELLADPAIRNLIYDINMYSAQDLFKIAQDLVEAVENGEVPDEKMEEVEKKLIVILAAIKDKVLVRVKTRHYEGHSISR